MSAPNTLAPSAVSRPDPEARLAAALARRELVRVVLNAANRASIAERLYEGLRVCIELDERLGNPVVHRVLVDAYLVVAEAPLRVNCELSAIEGACAPPASTELEAGQS